MALLGRDTCCVGVDSGVLGAVVPGEVVGTGSLIAFKCLRLRRDRRTLPSSLTVYCLFNRASTTVPDLSHSHVVRRYAKKKNVQKKRLVLH